MRKLHRAAFALALASAAAAGATGATVSADALLAGLAQTPPAATPFIQVSYRGVLDRPLVVSGTLRWPGGERLERDIDKPFRETATIDSHELTLQRGDGAVRRVPLARAPQAGAMLAGFRAMLGGDLAALQQDFTLSAEGNEAHWVVTLTPRAPALARQLASIVIDGRARAARCLTVRDANGDASITLVSTLATAGLRSVAPLESALAARCRNEP